jgi:hypothetical protein
MPGRKAANRRASDLPRIVLVDANVFFAPRMRDLFMYLHEAEVINVHWTREIEAEWTRNVIGKQSADRQAIQDCLQGMRAAAEGWEVLGYEKHIDRFEAVDLKDRHVAAAAYKLSLDDWPGQAVALVTKNVRDFPRNAFKDTKVVRYAMPVYLDALRAETPDAVAKVADACRKKLKAPRLTQEEYVAVLMKNGCSGLAQALADRWSVECPAMSKNGTLFYRSEKYAGKLKHRQPSSRAKD